MRASFAALEGKTVLCGNVKLMERNNIDLSGYHGTPGSTEVLLALDGRFLGHIDIADTVKSDAKQRHRPHEGAGSAHGHADR